MTLHTHRQQIDLGLLVIRAGIGLGMFYYFGFPKLSGTAAGLEAVGRSMTHLGITSGFYYWGLLAGLAEGVGGLLLITGLIFRPAALAMASVMAMAFIEQLSRPMPAAGHPFNNFWVFLGLFLAGPGRYSVDAWLFGRRQRTEGHHRP